MRHAGATQAKLRTKPPGNPHVVEEKRFMETWVQEGWYPILSWGTSGGFQGFTVAPGTYIVELSVDGKEFTQELVVKKDPRSEGTLEDIQAQIDFQKKIRSSLNTTSTMISQIEWMRKQCYDLKDMLSAGGNSKEMMESIDEMDKKLRSVEDELFQYTIAEGDSKSFRFPQKLYCKLSVLAGDVSGSVDFAPNKQQREVYDVLKERLKEQTTRFVRLLTEVNAFNDFLKNKNVAGLVAPQIK
jgi:hypothetical protein